MSSTEWDSVSRKRDSRQKHGSDQASSRPPEVGVEARRDGTIAQNETERSEGLMTVFNASSLHSRRFVRC